MTARAQATNDAFDYTTITLHDGTTYGIYCSNDGDGWLANVAVIAANGDVEREVGNEDGFYAEFGAQASVRDCIIRATQWVF